MLSNQSFGNADTPRQPLCLLSPPISQPLISDDGRRRGTRNQSNPMESTLITRFSPLLPSPYKSRPLSPPPLAGARRIDSISFSSGSVCGALRPRGGATSSVTAAAAALGDAAEPASEAILLSVQGMMCDGCAASVKRILEGQPEVTSATVDYKEARAVVWTTPEVKVTADWQKQWGEKLASHLGTCGFESSPQGQGEA
ncbi:hypothetical protein ACQ4PT_019877 [Festuca glaucescens]